MMNFTKTPLRLVLIIIISLSFSFAINAQSAQVPTNTSTPAQKRTILIPTAFSPNNDGLNDVFKLSNITNEQLVEFRVFNRWGTILYTSKDINSGWDGTYKGHELPIGVYGYAIIIRYGDGAEEIYKGTVTLIR